MTTTKPSQAYLKAYLEQRHKSQNPPPSPQQIRTELGWKLLQR